MSAVSAHPLNDWFDLRREASRQSGDAKTSLEADAFTLMAVAMFNAVNAIDPRYTPFHFTELVREPCDAELAAAAAAHFMLLRIYPAQKTVLDAAFERQRTGVADEAKKRCGERVGKAAASALLAIREPLTVDVQNRYRPNVRPGRWTPDLVPGGYGHVNAKPWVLPRPRDFFPPAPPALNSAEWAQEYAEVKELGRIDSRSRSADQTAAALFWDSDGGGSNLAQKLWDLPDLSLVQKVRAFALFGIVESDTGLVLIRAKYHYRFWRPIVAIRNGDRDGNPLTVRDATWQPLGEGSRTGEYPCGHCADAATYLYTYPRLIGHDIPGGIDLTDDAGKVRHYDTIAAMAEEESNSRIWLGAHYSGSSKATYEMTKRIADHIIARYLTPLSQDSP